MRWVRGSRSTAEASGIPPGRDCPRTSLSKAVGKASRRATIKRADGCLTGVMKPHRAESVWARLQQLSGAAPLTVIHVCDAAVTGAGVDGAAVTLMSSSLQQDTVHASNRIAAELQESQLTLGQGPCVDAFATGSPVLAEDLGAERYLRRWPAFVAAAASCGVCAMFAIPIQVGAIQLGVLDLYRTATGPLTAAQLSEALAFADVACLLMLNGARRVPTEAAESAWQDDDPTAHQAHVHQATGMLLAQLGTTAEAAFARLRSYAYAHDRRLGDVARDVVERRLRFEPDPPVAGAAET